jgi:deoxyribose-phosphate aldolase
VKLKAAGGIRDIDSAIEAVELQCDRFGASKTAAILDAWRQRLGLAPIEADVLKSTGGGSY